MTDSELESSVGQLENDSPMKRQTMTTTNDNDKSKAAANMCFNASGADE